MTKLEKITRATIVIKDENDKCSDCVQFVPDYVLHNAARDFGLTLDECRKIRDIVQAAKSDKEDAKAT